MTGMLASIHSLDEAKIAMQVGVDIIDLKEPAKGILGALPIRDVKKIVGYIDGATQVSATIGDLPVQSPDVEKYIMKMHETGVDYVKVGVFGKTLVPEFLTALKRCAAQGVSIVLVYFAEQLQTLPDVALLADSGIKGVMIDTQEKASGTLLSYMNQDMLREFVCSTQDASLVCGLAGSLRSIDVPVLLQLQPDYLGFRGALCKQHDRVAEIDKIAMMNLKKFFVIDTNELETVEKHYGAVAR